MSSPASTDKHLMITPHGTLTLRKLSSIKIVDKCSCYVIGLKPDIANEKTLSQHSYFGQFGVIKCVRVIQRKIPSEAHIRFDNESSAKAAIIWCQNQNISAHHGYWKYCIKFITNKICKKKQCHNKHSWCDQNDDIIDKHKYNESVGGKENNNDENNKTEETDILQTQFMHLRSQYFNQNQYIHNLLQQLQTLKAENTSLKLENIQLMTQQNNNNDWNPDPDPDIDEIVDAVIRNDDKNIIFSNSESDTTQEG